MFSFMIINVHDVPFFQRPGTCHNSAWWYCYPHTITILCKL